MPIPSYTFVTSGGQRRFVHRWQFENNEVIECNKCGSTCRETDAYSKHWSQPKTLDNELEPSMAMGTTMTTTPSASSYSRMTTLMEHKQVIVSKNIESFMLCDTKAVSDTQQFLLDAGIKAVPDLLSAAAYANGPGHIGGLGVVVRFYVKIKDEMFMLQTAELAIKHHYDIRESVDMIFAMLLEKLRTFMTCLASDRPHYTIQRINIKVRRHPNPTHLTLPLQYARKHGVREEDSTDIHTHTDTSTPTSTTTSNSMQMHDLTIITTWFRKYLLSSAKNADTAAPPFVCNLYCFQECHNSKQLYVVPFHLSSAPSDILSTRSFVILCDIFNNFVELQEISNIRRFLHQSFEDRVVTCSHCHMNFVEPTKLMLHKALNCGEDIEILRMDSDFIEIYEHCLLLEKCDSWSLFGVIK